MSREYAETFRQARLVELPNTGHLIWLERPDVYGAEILAFLRQKQERGAARSAARVTGAFGDPGNAAEALAATAVQESLALYHRLGSDAAAQADSGNGKAG